MPKILLVDDELGMRDMLWWSLSAAGYELARASDGVEAQAVLEEGGVDLVLTDITMPRRDGFELLRAVAGRPGSPPVIMMTGFGTVEMAVEAMRLGAADFLLKPCDLARLLERVRECLYDARQRATTSNLDPACSAPGPAGGAA